MAPDTATFDLQRWCIDAACRDTVSRAAELTDRQDHDGFVALFTPDAVLQRPSGEVLMGRAAILAAYQARPAQRQTHHLLAGTVVDITAHDSAVARTRVLLYASDTAEPPGAMGRTAQGPALVGRFEDRLSRDEAGRWLIRERRASFDLVAPGAS